MLSRSLCLALLVGSVTALASSATFASSHREAPFVAGMPRIDGTDFYMFNSYETGRAGYVTILANYDPLQDAYGGPNYFALDPNAMYAINIDNQGNALADIQYQFRFTNTFNGLGVPTGSPSGNVAIPLINLPPNAAGQPTLNRVETYTANVVINGVSTAITTTGGATTFTKPLDNIGQKSFAVSGQQSPANYAAYANQYIYNVNIPGCTPPAGTTPRMFVGQRAEGFVVNLGQVFDLVNLNPLGARNSAATAANPTGNTIGNKNITTIALEVPASCLTNGTDPVIGGWTTSYLPQSRVLNPSPTGPVASSAGKGPSVVGGAWTQVSRLGSPLVNEVVIGLPDKDKFNASQPANDLANFANYVEYPTLPVLVKALFNVPPPATPRTDLVAAFVTGITTGPTDTPANFKFTAPANLTTPGEMLRLNTAIAATPYASQSDLGFLGCDLAGFPNGRRPIDDVVDIELTVVEGAITAANPNKLQTCSLSGATPAVVNAGAVVNDGAEPNPAAYLQVFPYLNTPTYGSP
ncbi:MAG: DUF4331 domain-containing protein [Stenotrophobium sp.]